MKTINLGVIGCGKRADSVLSHLFAIKPPVKLAALCDSKEDRMNSLNKKYSSNAKTYTDENSFFSHPGMDWVMICSPNNTHRRHIELSVKNNLKIFCEKPLATSIDDLSAIMNTINSSNTPCMIGFTLRYSPFYRKIKSLLQSGIIGKPVSFEFNETIGFNHGGHIMRDWRRNSADSGGHLLEKCCHDIDLANWMTDSIPVRVASFGGRNFFLPENAVRMDELAPDTNGLKAYCSYDHVGDSLDNPFTGEGDIIDNQVCIFEYKNGIRATFHTNLNAGILERRMYILGTHGALRGDVLTGQIETKKIGFDTPYERHDMTAASGGHGGGDKVLAPYLVKMMTENVESLTPAIDGAVSAAVAIITDEARKDGSVKSLDGIWKKWGV